MRSRFAAVATLVTGVTLATADDWPQWRGPHGNGISTEKGLPTRWAADQVAWKAPLAGLGISSPIVWGDRVFVTSQGGRGALRPGNHPTLARGEEAKDEKPLGGGGAADESGAVSFLVEAFHRRDGRRLWQHRLKAEGDLPAVHQKHNLASPSPVTDGKHVYAWFGNGQVVALDMDGGLVWQRHLGKDYAPFDIQWGHGSSPTLYKDLLLLLCDHVPGSYLLALDRQTGKERFKVSETGDTIVLGAGRAPRVLGRNPLGERSLATPALSRGQIFIRTDDHLICVGKAS